MTVTIHFFHNRQSVWDSDGWSVRFGFNYGNRAVSLYVMFGSTEHWYGLGW